MRSPLSYPFLALGLSMLVLGASAPIGHASDDDRPPIDREEHETVKTATFALG